MAERQPDLTDRRAKLVAITDAGKAGLDVANATRERLLTQIFGALSEADRATLFACSTAWTRRPEADLGIGHAGRTGDGLGMTAGSAAPRGERQSHFLPGGITRYVIHHPSPAVGVPRKATIGG